MIDGTSPNVARDAGGATARLNAFGALEASELADLRAAAGPERVLGAEDTLWREGDRLPGLSLLVEGWAASTMSFGDGRRQMLKIHLAGDVLGMPSLAMTAAAETLVALSPVRVRSLPLYSLGHLFESHPRLAAMLFLVSQEERVHLMDRLASVGRTGATQRLAAVIVHLRDRVERSFPDTGDSFRLPITLEDLADLVGLDTGRTRQALDALREENLAGWSGDRMTILDLDALRRLSDLPARQVVDDPAWLPAGE